MRELNPITGMTDHTPGSVTPERERINIVLGKRAVPPPVSNTIWALCIRGDDRFVRPPLDAISKIPPDDTSKITQDDKISIDKNISILSTDPWLSDLIDTVTNDVVLPDDEPLVVFDNAVIDDEVPMVIDAVVAEVAEVAEVVEIITEVTNSPQSLIFDIDELLGDL